MAKRLSAKTKTRIMNDLKTGMKQPAIAKKYGISKLTVHNYKKKQPEMIISEPKEIEIKQDTALLEFFVGLAEAPIDTAKKLKILEILVS